MTVGERPPAPESKILKRMLRDRLLDLYGRDSGERAASGFYIYLISDDQGRKAHGKFALIR